MRKVTLFQIMVFSLLCLLIMILGLGLTWLLLTDVPLGDFRGIFLVGTGAFLSLLFAILIYRCLMKLFPLPFGNVESGSVGEFAAQMNILFYTTIFNSFIRTHFLPVTFSRWLYIALGADLGSSTYCAGTILDPMLTSVGSNTLIGHNAVVYAHMIDGSRFTLSRVRLGSEVTIGAMAIIMPDVVIGDGAIIAAGAVVTKGTRVGPDEIWGGVPARMIKKRC